MDKYTNTTIVVADLCEKTQYQFRVSAENQIGVGSYSSLSDLHKTLGRYRKRNSLFLVHFIFDYVSFVFF